MMVEELWLPHDHPYHTAGGTDVDPAIQDEELIANICQYVIIHMDTPIHLAAQGQPTKKQFSLNAGSFRGRTWKR